MLIMDNQNNQNNQKVWEEYHAYLQFCSSHDEAAILKAILEQDHRFAACIICGVDIEQPYYGGRTRRYCDRPGCRKRGNRIMRRFQRWCWEQKTQAQFRLYWKELLLDSQHELEALLQSKWILTESEEGTTHHRQVDICDRITRLLDNERRAAWRKVERYTVVFEQRAERAEERVTELEEELKALRQLLPGAQHEEIVAQPRYVSVVDSAPGPHVVTTVPAADERDDQLRVTATLASIGLLPYTGQESEE